MEGICLHQIFLLSQEQPLLLLCMNHSTYLNTWFLYIDFSNPGGVYGGGLTYY